MRLIALALLWICGAGVTEAQTDKKMIGRDVEYEAVLVVRESGPGFDVTLVFGDMIKVEDLSANYVETALGLARLELRAFLAMHRWCMNGYTLERQSPRPPGVILHFEGVCK